MILAPSNDAFRMFNMNNRQMQDNNELMMKILRRSFVINRKLMPSEITNELVIDNFAGEKLRFNIYDTVLFIHFK